MGAPSTPGTGFPGSTFPGFAPPQSGTISAALPVATISTPLAPPPQQYTNIATLINGQYQETAVLLFWNGLLLTHGLDYTRRGGQVTMTPAIPNAGDTLTAQVYAVGKQLGGATQQRYIAPWSFSVAGPFDGVGTAYQIQFGPTISGITNGINNLFTWGVTLQRSQVWRNGVLQTIGQDYYSGPTAMVFFPGSLPQPGDLITMLGY